MNANAKAWVAALESGEWKQCRGTLTDLVGEMPSHCCLGVACELAVKAGVPLTMEDDYTKRIYRDGSGGSTSVLTLTVMNWLGLSSENGTWCDESGHSSLASENDRGKTFSEIAQIIREHEKELFVSEAAHES